MATMTQDWTDSRIADLAQRVDNGFAQVDRRFEQVDRRFEQVHEEQRELRLWMTHAHREVRVASERSAREVREELATVASELRGEIKALGDGHAQQNDGLNHRFDELQQTLLSATFAAIFCLIAGIVTLIATQIS